MTDSSCPCGSGAPYLGCCGLYLEGALLPPTAEALMRSRYCAFVRRDSAYLLATWDPSHRPAKLDLRGDRTEWLGLQIVSREAGTQSDQTGQVTFIARFRSQGVEQALHEHSRFRKEGERWLYIAPTTGRNDPCPCGSGKKYKKCCG